MLPGFCDDVVTVLRAPLVSSRGGQVRDWGQATSHEVPGCSMQEASSETMDRTGRASNVSMTNDLYLPAGADICAGDRVEFDGATYEVVGQPLSKRSPFGRCDHTLAHLAYWRG